MPRKPFVFMLSQNLAQLSYSILAYDERMLESTMNELVIRLKPIFFAGIGTACPIFGPFTIFGEPYMDQVPLDGLCRLEEDPQSGIWTIHRPALAKRLRFRPEPENQKIEKGLSWEYVRRLLGLDHNNKRKLIEVDLEPEQIELLSSKLREINI